MHEILTIWMKEMRDTIRDRRTLIVMIVVPVLVTPAMLVGMSKLSQASNSKPVTVAVANMSAAPQLITMLRQQLLVTVTSNTDPVGAVKGSKADAGLIIDAHFLANIARGQPGHVVIVQDSTQSNSNRAAAAISSTLALYSAHVVVQRLQARGMSPGLLAPVASDSRDVATKQALAGFVLSLIVPLFLVIYSMTGGMYTAMDLSAGEKERFTLEALLLSPATKLQITLGKLLAVSTVAVFTIILALVALFVALQRVQFTSDSSVPQMSLPPEAIILIALLGGLLAISFSALELALGVFARSFKEAQNYITPLYLVAVLPVAMLSSLPGFKPSAPFFIIPALDTVLVFKEALVGAIDGLHVAITVVTMLVFCAACIAVTLRIFSNEKVLLRT